jgi:hypothetical protein
MRHVFSLCRFLTSRCPVMFYISMLTSYQLATLSRLYSSSLNYNLKEPLPVRWSLLYSLGTDRTENNASSIYFIVAFLSDEIITKKVPLFTEPLLSNGCCIAANCVCRYLATGIQSTVLRTPSSGMLRRVVLVRTDVWEECITIISVIRIGELGTTLAVTSHRRTLRRNTK